MKQKTSRWLFWGVVALVVVLLMIFFFFVSPSHPPTVVTSSPTSTPARSVTFAGQYPNGFPMQLVLFKNISPVSGGSVVDPQGHTHLVVQFSPEASAAQVFNTYKTGLPPLGWKITNSGFIGTSTQTMVLFVNASNGTDTLNVTAQTVPHGTNMTLEVVE